MAMTIQQLEVILLLQSCIYLSMSVPIQHAYQSEEASLASSIRKGNTSGNSKSGRKDNLLVE
jgi:hypothetical protein